MSLKTASVMLAAGMALPVMACRLSAQEPEATVEYRASEVKKGSDFAPSEQTVSVRVAADYRRPKGVLGTAAHEPTRVDANSLYQRRAKMYEGTTYTDSLAGQQPRDPEVMSRLVPPSATGRVSRTCTRILVLAIPLLLFGVFLIWWQRQAKFAAEPTSQIVRLRSEPRRRGRSRAAEEKQVREK